MESGQVGMTTEHKRLFVYIKMVPLSVIGYLMTKKERGCVKSNIKRDSRMVSGHFMIKQMIKFSNIIQWEN